MSEVIGPIPLDEWRVLSIISSDIRWRQRIRMPIDVALQKDIKIFYNILKKYLTKEISPV